MKTQTVNISFSDELLRDIDSVSREEARSRSEFIREAARAYIAKKRVWKGIFRSTRQHVKAVGLKEKDIAGAIADYRLRKG
ncbi:MAG: ribbon-helix-helix domain-containing protein [Candidatus Omnitrophota bacterium]|nr:ribbon-helix-helix domain-containing protein [Candidatus Omnitrophota bacterium]